MTHSSKIKIMLIDDNPFFRAGLKGFLDQTPAYEVIAEADTLELALQIYEKNRSDLVILDLSAPYKVGLDAINKFVNRFKNVKIVILSMYESPIYLKRALYLGVKAYLTKSSSYDELKEAIHTVLKNEIYLSKGLSQKIAFSRVTGTSNELDKLSTKELEVFRLLAEGAEIEEIAALLNMSCKSIANYQTKIKNKLNITSPTDLVRYAILEGLIKV